MEPAVLSVGVLFGGFVGLLVLYWGQVTAPRRLVRSRVSATRDGAGGLAPALRDASGRVPLVDRLPLSAAARERMDQELDRAGVPLRVSEYLALRTLVCVGSSIAGIVLTVSFGLPVLLGVLLAMLLLVVGWKVPARWVEAKRQARVRKIESQLPEALTLVSKSLRAGAGLTQAIAFAADETPAPLGPELARALRDLRLGANAEDVFVQLSQRVGSQDLDIAVTAIIIQRTVGGNLAEILSTVVSTIRARERLRADVLVLTSRQRLTSRMMAGMPVVIATAFVLINPQAGMLLFTTLPGWIALGFAITMELAGLFIISRLGVIDI
jgi:tight adherence protein B